MIPITYSMRECIKMPLISNLIFSKRPRIRQYFVNGVLHRSKNERRVTWDELFFDLIFVAMTASVGHVLSSNASIEGVQYYISL
jgi:low temperature requirement protein LtrA